jgi:hypothetical protein
MGYPQVFSSKFCTQGTILDGKNWDHCKNLLDACVTEHGELQPKLTESISEYISQETKWEMALPFIEYLHQHNTAPTEKQLMNCIFSFNRTSKVDHLNHFLASVDAMGFSLTLEVYHSIIHQLSQKFEPRLIEEAMQRMQVAQCVCSVSHTHTDTPPVWYIFTHAHFHAYILGCYLCCAVLHCSVLSCFVGCGPAASRCGV